MPTSISLPKIIQDYITRNRNNNNAAKMKPNIIKILLAVFVLAIVGLVSCLSLSSTRQPDKGNRVTEKEGASDMIPSASETVADNQPWEKVSDKTYDSFEDVLNGLNAYEDDEVWLSIEYFYYDITQDGKPELWVRVGTCEADMKLYIFTEDNVVHKIFETSGFHSSFYAGKGYVVRQVTDSSSNTWYKMRYKNGGIQDSVCFHREIDWDSDEDMDIQDERVYKTPPEEPIELLSLISDE